MALRAASSLARFPAALALVDAFDEAASGLPVNTLYELGDGYQAGATALSAAVFVAPYLAALLLDGPLLLWSQRFERRLVLAWGLVGMAGSVLACAFAPNLWCFALAFALFSPASGIACGMAQAMLMDAEPERREHNMTNWAFAGWVGDLAGPGLFWCAAALGFGFRSVFVLVAASVFLPAAWLLLKPLALGVEQDEDDEDEDLSFREALAVLRQHPALFIWSGGVALCALLDEVVAGLVGLRIHEAHGNAEWVARTLLAFGLGGLLGLGALKPLLARFAPTRLLAASCLGTAFFYALWLLLQPSPATLWLLGATGLCVAAQYPLAQAQAYRALPEHSTWVVAAAQPFLVLELAMPLAVGYCAEHFGIVWGLALLSVQPLGLLVAIYWARALAKR